MLPGPGTGRGTARSDDNIYDVVMTRIERMALVESRVKHVTSSALSWSPHELFLARGEGETARQRLISNYIINPHESVDLLPNDTGCNRPPTT
jgi:hypothetical protein